MSTKSGIEYGIDIDSPKDLPTCSTKSRRERSKTRSFNDDIVVIPKRINDEHSNYCDYTGIIPLGLFQKTIEVPRHSSFGISCIEYLSGRAAKDVYIFCRSNGIYPINSTHSEFSTWFPDVNVNDIRVQRSNGTIEQYWSIDMYSSTSFEDGEVLIPVINTHHDMIKGIPIRLFCKLNSIPVDNLTRYLSTSLFKWFLKVDGFSEIINSTELTEEKFF